jgi:hypothetical protein
MNYEIEVFVESKNAESTRPYLVRGVRNRIEAEAKAIGFAKVDCRDLWKNPERDCTFTVTFAKRVPDPKLGNYADWGEVNEPKRWTGAYEWWSTDLFDETTGDNCDDILQAVADQLNTMAQPGRSYVSNITLYHDHGDMIHLVCVISPERKEIIVGLPHEERFARIVELNPVLAKPIPQGSPNLVVIGK